MEKVKIVVIGPMQTGKTAIANFVSGYREQQQEYKPTTALRIMEYEATGLNFNKSSGATRYQGPGSSKASVELWDVSGNDRYQSCWPAIMKDTNGILMVYNPDTKGQDKELDEWFKNFAIPTKVKEQCVTVFAHRASGGGAKVPGIKPKLSKTFAKVKAVETTLEYGNDEVKHEIDRLIENIVITRREVEENSILDGSVAAPR